MMESLQDSYGSNQFAGAVPSSNSLERRASIHSSSERFGIIDARMSARDATSVDSAERPRCLRLHGDDNVAVMLGDTERGAVVVMSSGTEATMDAVEPIASGHKIALRPIRAGEAVIKYGVVIGYATSAIDSGRWVHTQNCRSRLDERSHTLDPHTGAPTDTQYA
jgi:hypothetical protein